MVFNNPHLYRKGLSEMNLIPSKPGISPNYYCTWATQGNVAKKAGKVENNNHILFEGDQGAKWNRNYLNDEILFGEDGFALQYENAREDLYFLLDDGWDVPYNVHPDTQLHEFGSLLLNEDRFPSCSGEPEERLYKMNNRLQALGWRGLGIWIAAQAQGERESRTLSDNEFVEYWTKRLIWCRNAGVNYWKVDWGLHLDSVDFRHGLTKLGREHHPQLLIEHARCMGPINDKNNRFNFDDIARDIFSISDVFRSYDVTRHLRIATTMDRLSALLLAKKQSPGIINVEDEVYIGAALGCSFGVMRSRFHSNNLTEVVRAVKWQKVAPAFAEGTAHISDDIATDSWYFQSGDTWASYLIGHEVKQCSPIVISRNMPSPQFYDIKTKPPFIVTAKNPNGAVSIATLPRTSTGSIETPLCGIELNVGNSESPIGIFGYYGSLTLCFDQPIGSKKIHAQDLAKSEAQDISNLVAINENRVTIHGDLIAKISSNEQGDTSRPGLILSVRRT